MIEKLLIPLLARAFTVSILLPDRYVSLVLLITTCGEGGDDDEETSASWIVS